MMKNRSGLRYVSVCAQGGMLEIGVISPLVRIKMMRKKSIIKAACWVVSE